MVPTPRSALRHTAAAPVSVRLTPLAAALALAWSLPALAAPPVAAVPVPAATWRVSGSGKTSAPVNTANAQGGVDQTISQTSARAIYNWQSFDIGANSSVTFDMSQTGASALNRVTGSTAPSQIFGQLKATKQGEILLINGNGILFGRGAQVNTGALIASTLDISDSEYQSGFAQSIGNPSNAALNAAFRYEGDPANFIDSRNFVRVDAGATLTTDSGGRIFLFAKKVDNAGSLNAPDGQVVLGAGGAAYLKLPSSESALYASETNPNVSALRGFLVEMGSGPATAPQGGNGSATNAATGLISTPRGNTTLVGLAVNQMGRISATTSVSENGSVILRAQGAAQSNDQGLDSVVRATQSGALTLGAGSSIQVLPDTATRSSTSTDSAGFATSHLDLAGQSIVFGTGASIVAPGATVNLRAETVPSYVARLSTAAFTGGELTAGDPAARIVMGDQAVIDVSGTRTAERSVADLFVTTELLGSNDLKDAPLQKDGLLYRSKVTIDTRQDSAILGSLDSYRANLGRTVEERLATGGTVDLRAEGAVLTHPGAAIRVTGGEVSYTAASVKPTLLVGSNGAVYDLATAPADLVYASALNLEKSSAIGYDRWGAKSGYGGSLARSEAGYVEGRDAGSVSIAAPVVALQGELKGGATTGERQRAGLDARASAGSLTLGATVNHSLAFMDTTANLGPDAVLQDFRISASGPVIADDTWTAPAEAALPTASGISASRLATAGFDNVTVVANGDVRFDAVASQPFQLNRGGILRLWSGYGDVSLAQSLRAADGRVELISRDHVTVDIAGNPYDKDHGRVSLADGVSVDLSGEWLNQWADGRTSSTVFTGGGSFVAGGYGVSLGQGSVVDVSGGASVSLSGSTVTGAAAGSIQLADYTSAAHADQALLTLGGSLRGYSARSSNGVASGGGSLSLSTTRVQIGDGRAAEGTLALGTDFFNQGGFGSFAVDGRLALDVLPGAVLAPQQAVWQATAASRNVPSGATAADALGEGLAPGVRRGGVNLALASSGDSLDATGRSGVLTVGEGAQLNLGPQATVSLQAAHRLDELGSIQTAGGSVSLSLKSTAVDEANVLQVGDGAVIDVAGTRLLTPDSTDGLLHGTVVNGGSISMSVGSRDGYLGSLVLHRGATLDASGGQGLLDVTERSNSGISIRRSTVASQGGSVSFSGNGDLWLEGDMHLGAQQASVAGGSLSVTQLPGRAVHQESGAYDARSLQLVAARQQDTLSLPADALQASGDIRGRAVVSADWVQASGASDFNLATSGAVQLGQGVTLDMARGLSVKARALVADADSATRLSGASVTLGWSGLDLGSVNASDLPAYQATSGNASLQVSARNGLVLDGHLVTQGLGQLALNSAGDLRLQSRDSYSGTHYHGSLATGADLSISAAQVYPTTDTRFVIDASGHRVSFGAGNSSATAPLSANGELQVQAAQIVQGGVLRAPLGQIGLHATESLTLAAGSETSVSADGSLIPYGTLNSSSGEWIRPQANGTLTAPGAKEVVLDAPSVTTAAGSVVNVSGGGDLQATEFVAGKGGSTDILAGGSGSYAIVPTVTGLSPRDPAYAATEPLLGKQIVITRAVTLGDGSTLAAGRYTLLPARYAMLPGAFLLRSATGSAALAEGTVQARTDGTVTLGARLADAGTGFSDSLPANWQLMSKAEALTHSEIRVTTASQFFAAQAAKAGTATPELPRDGGSLVITAQAADLQGQGRFGAGKDAQGVSGQAGLLDIVANQIEVDASLPAATGDGVLHLSAAQLNQLGSGTVVLGGSRAADGGDASALNVAASRISFQQGATALTVADLVAVATEQISVGDGARFAPKTGADASAAQTLGVSGGGAALRVAAQAGAGLTRSTQAADGASLQVGAGVQFQAASGSLVLDSSGSTTVADSTTLKAQDITLASGTVVLGGGVPRADQLVLTPAQLDSLGSAQQLTLRAYDHMTLAAGAQLGSPALQTLVLDTPVLAAGFASQPATVTAGDLTLTNTAGRVVNAPAAGSGELSLRASSAQGGSGLLHLGDGQLAVAGAAQLNLVADQAVSLSGAGKLVTAGDLQVQTPGVVAAQSRADYALQAGGAVVLGQASTANLPTSADGAAFSVSGERVTVNGRVSLPSGQVTLAGTQGVSLAAGASLLTAGRDVVLDDQTVGQAGGSVQLSSSAGDISLAQGARIDVSGAAHGGSGGALSLSAAEGQVLMGAALLGSAASGADGAQLHIDAATGLNLTALGNRLDGQHFTGEIELRQREGNLIMAGAARLQAHTITVSADAGRLAVLGTLDASGAQGGSIALDARDGLVLGAGSQLLASSSQAGANGGRVALGSSSGQIAFAADSLIDLQAGATTATTTPDGGRLTLRAAQLGSQVAIAPLLGQVDGASRIDVQAVKVYSGYSTVADTSAPGQLSIGRIDADAARFVGDQGQNATAIAQRLGGSQPALTELIKVHAEAEVRSTGNLTMTAGADLAMTSESNTIAFMGGDATHVGDHSLTLRAGGNLTVLRGVSSGLASTGTPYANDGGTVRMVAGADLNAAAVMQTGHAAHDLVLAPAAGSVYTPSITGSSTGDLALAASGNLQMRKTGTLLLTTGKAPDAEAQAVADRLWFFQNNNLAFATQGGNISLQAGGNILANDEIPFAFEAYGRNSWAQQTNLIGSSSDYAWYAYSGFGRGAMAFGGGDIRVRAGQDVVRLVALAPSSGYQLQASDTQAASERHFAGGSVSVQAGRDVVDGMFAAGGAELKLQAGRDVVRRAVDGVLQPGTRLYYEDTAVQVDARRDLTLGSVSSRFVDNLSSDGQSSVLLGLDGQAELRATAAGGDLDLRNQATTQDSQTAWIPASTVLAAPAGSLSLGTLLQQPQTDGVMRALAGQDLTVTGPITVNATQTSATGTRFLQGLDAQAPEAGVLSDGASLQDQSSRSPLQLVAATGDLTVATDNGIRSARPLRWVAGGDISLQGPLQAQQQSDALTGAAGEQSLLQAGRDIQFHSAVLRVGGAGEVTLLAGRDIDLGNADRGPGGSGLMATGNTDNALLAARSASVSLVAGLRADGADYRQAVSQGFELLGSSALSARAGDLYAWLTASADSAPALGSAEAQAFTAQGAAQRLATVKAWLGDSAYQTALARYVRGLPGQQGLSDAQAVAAFAGLSVARQEAAPAALLAAQLAGLPSARRLAFISQVAAADTPRYVAGLQAWMKARTGQTLSAEQALAQFEQLPVERQLSWVNQVLVEELRTAGRTAASATGRDKEAAYLRGYLAIDTVFPGERPSGDIRLPSTQVKTLQAAGETLVAASGSTHSLDLSGISLMTPGGGVNAGEVGSSSQSANNLGVVTVAGGDISAVSRDDFLVNQSRVFSLREGDILLWSSQGDIDAGRGAKTVSGAPAPVLRLDPLTGKLYLDTSGSFSGSGIAVLDSGSDLDLYAPSGAIDAGEAGIRAQGNVFLGAVTVRGADNIQVGGNVAGATLSAAPAVVPAALAPVPTDSSKAGSDDEDERQKRRRARRNLLLDFLGFGRG